MRPATKICLRALNKGKPTESLVLDEVPVMDALRELASWLAGQEMGKRFDICLGRNPQDVNIVYLDPRVRAKNEAANQMTDDLFDPELWLDVPDESDIEEGDSQ